MHLRSLIAAGAAILLALGLAACNEEDGKPNNNTAGSASTQISIISGSENKTLEPMIQQWARDNNVAVNITYEGSVEIMLELEKGAGTQYDAVWPANRMWIAMGDKQHVVKHTESIYRTPVVFGVKKSVAQRLGWIGRDVTVNDILTAARSGQLRFMMTSATQSNSGASGYFGFLYAFAGHPDVLTSDHLKDPNVRSKIKSILGSVNRTAGSSGFLKDLFVQQYDYYDAMVNYEAMVIEANTDLMRSGRDPLYAVYPVDGLSIADSALGYVNKGDAAKEQAFLKLQEYLLSQPIQSQLLALGRRTGLGVNVANADPTVFNPALGLDGNKVLSPINTPDADVIREALMLYQTAFRKPSITVFALDYSTSMQGGPEQALESAMRGLLDQDLAAKYLLQASPEDITIVIPFNSGTIDVNTVKGNDPAKLRQLLAWVEQHSASGGTNIYAPSIDGLREIKKIPGWEDYSVAVILMTDGASDEHFGELRDAITQLGMQNVPIYSIMFGDARKTQLDAIAAHTQGKVFNGKADLISAFRQAKGYNN
ncbi:MAG: VWA domain-containing protein [Candidatus Melainabacteria bacterium]|nr:VWA domain-containing protein [Candidatus Melainabacteria bacterium]